MKIGRDRRFHKLRKDSKRARIFISHRHKDSGQVSFLRNQRKTSCLEFTDYSIKKPYSLFWKSSARYRIRNSDGVIIALGSSTHKSRSVEKEINIAKKYNKPIIGVPLRKGVAIPKAMVGVGKIIKWNCKNIQKEIDKFRRKRK